MVEMIIEESVDYYEIYAWITNLNIWYMHIFRGAERLCDVVSEGGHVRCPPCGCR